MPTVNQACIISSEINTASHFDFEKKFILNVLKQSQDKLRLNQNRNIENLLNNLREIRLLNGKCCVCGQLSDNLTRHLEVHKLGIL